MQFSIQGKALSQALKSVGRVIPKRAARPILQNVLVLAKGAIELAGTDMEVGMRVKLEGETVGTGEILIPAVRLSTILRGINGQMVTFQAEGDKAEVSWPKRRFTLVGEDAADFPVIPQYPAGKGLQIDAGTFLEMFKRVSFATADEESRYAIHGLLISVKGGKVTFVATDGKRLAVQTGTIQGRGTFEALIPARVMADISAAIPKRGKDLGSVHILPKARRVLFQYGDATFVAAKIDGTFPNWEEVIPSKSKYRISVDSAELTAAIKDAGILASEGSHSVSLKFEDQTLAISAKVSNVGDCQAEVPIEMDDPSVLINPIDVHFNPKYLLDYLKASDAHVVTFWITDPRSAVKLTDGTDGAHVLMPITLET
ncbi:MAG: DNA polymerase III subunit beta [Planctomycetota bacterium]|nr:DNA polymerase III subunit beta [Planctomycetota bacterium]